VRDFFQKLRLLLLYKLSKLIEVKPFLRIDKNAYCPSCGHRKGKITVVVLAAPDKSRSKVAVLHECEVDHYKWLEPSVSIIENHILGGAVEDDEQAAIDVMTADKRTKNVRAVRKVNGELV
jgi:hypothetical protein